MQILTPYESALDEIKELREELAKERKLRLSYEEALTPSGDTKAHYIGEISFSIPDGYVDEYSDEWIECDRLIVIPWDSTKEIMKMIKDRANES